MLTTVLLALRYYFTRIYTYLVDGQRDVLGHGRVEKAGGASMCSTSGRCCNLDCIAPLVPRLGKSMLKTTRWSLTAVGEKPRGNPDGVLDFHRGPEFSPG